MNWTMNKITMWMELEETALKIEGKAWKLQRQDIESVPKRRWDTKCHMKMSLHPDNGLGKPLKALLVTGLHSIREIILV